MHLLIDNYDSFTYNVVQLLGELGAEITVARNDQITFQQACDLQPESLIISPGPGTPDDAGISLELIRHFADKIPVLGICLGAQLIADVLGARVYANEHKEIGWFPVERADSAGTTEVGRAFPESLEAFHWHGDTFDLPDGAVHLARSAICENQAFLHKGRVLALQFHLETTRETAEMLIENCRDELDGGPHVQSAEFMLSSDARF